ncbi:GMC oxidoreductase [Microbulbifer sp. TRSA001]|uniref:GMC oxidoreductase n=1 Tax=Microbulbifer sp. TRSA001 TaxID=3243381 RepID=UPI0040395B45
MQNDELLIQKESQIFDAIVIGSGISGGWAAKELTERGLNTLMIDRGRMVKHGQDYPTENKGPWEFPLRTKMNLKEKKEIYPIQSRSIFLNESTKHFFCNDNEQPYSTEPGSDFTWIRGNQVGGKSLLWFRQSYRLSNHDFLANKRDGVGVDWPIRYKDIAPWYSKVERFAGISGNTDNIEQLPDSEYQPPFEMYQCEQDIKSKFEKQYSDKHFIIGRAAHLTKPNREQVALGRYNCQARNQCQRGCSFGGYFSTQSATMPAAMRTGKLQIASNSVVHSLIYNSQKNRVAGVRVIDSETLQQREYFGRIVFLCASTLGSTQILLNSANKHFPKGLANSSGVLGHYLMDHNYNASAHGFIDGYEDEYFSGWRPTGILIPNFQYRPELYRKHYKRGYQISGSAYRQDWRTMAASEGIGKSFKEKLQQPGRWGFWIGAQGEMLPRHENQVSLHSTKKDKWGIPQLHINCQWSENERLMMEDASETMQAMLKNLGLSEVSGQVTSDKYPPGSAIHEVGTARMGSDKTNSVLNGHNQSHDIPNLFVTDGSCFASSAVQNPSLTFMALTARAANYAASELSAGRL